MKPWHRRRSSRPGSNGGPRSDRSSPTVTLPPREEATVDHISADSARPDGAAPVRIRYFGDYELIAELAREGMGVACSYTPRQVDKYLSKISGPLLDRIDLHVEVPAVPFTQLAEMPPGPSSADLRAQVLDYGSLER